MPQTPFVSDELAQKITLVAVTQLRMSRMHKSARMAQIRESEDLYFGIVPKTLKNPFNESFPFMSGFVDHLLAKIDDPPQADIIPTREADLKLARRIKVAFENEKESMLPNAMWSYKDRTGKKLGIFSGRVIHKIHASSEPKYKSHFNTVDYKLFHCEPGGGGHLENHLFVGEEGIYKTEFDLVEGSKMGVYKPEWTKAIATGTSQNEYKENLDAYSEQNSRDRALGLDPVSNNYVGTKIFKLIEWKLTFEGKRYYCLFDEISMLPVRVVELKELYPSGLWDYVSWATHEEATVFWSKAPADDARPIGKTMNRLLNQELYNREKKNRGERLYDPELVHDLEALVNGRPDGMIPIDTKNGSIDASRAVLPVTVGDLSATIDLVQFLDGFTGQKTGTTPGSQGTAPENQKVGIYFGELKQVEDRIGIHNKSYKEAWAQIVHRFALGLEDHLSEPMALQIMGNNGIEWDELKARDFAGHGELKIKVRGGSDETIEEEIKNQKKAAVLPTLATVNPRWRDGEAMRVAGYSEEEIRQAFSLNDPATQELLSEAAQSIEDILRGRKPKINRGANAAFMQKIVDFAHDNELDEKKFNDLVSYAMSHATIAAENEARSAAGILRERAKAAAVAPMVEDKGGKGKPVEEAPVRIKPRVALPARIE